MVVFAVALNLLPALYLGWSTTMRCHLKVVHLMREIARIEDIAENGVEPPNGKNQGLPAFFARYLQSYPPGHWLHEDNPAFVQFGALDRATARHVAQGALLLVGAFVAWRMWGRWANGDSRFPQEWATTCAFCALLSPLCWRQHLVLALPPVLLMVHWHLVHRARWGAWFLGVVALLIWFPQRELMGKSLAYTFMSYKPDTLVVVATSLTILFLSPVAASIRSRRRTPGWETSIPEKRVA
jgi:hypothetical protein